MGYQIVNIELTAAGRMKLGSQLDDRMLRMGYAIHDFEKLNLGFEVPQNWPEDKNSELTLAQLTILANKLQMKIIISDYGIDLVPMNGE